MKRKAVVRTYTFILYGSAGSMQQTYYSLSTARRMIKANLQYGYDRVEFYRTVKTQMPYELP